MGLDSDVLAALIGKIYIERCSRAEFSVSPVQQECPSRMISIACDQAEQRLPRLKELAEMDSNDAGRSGWGDLVSTTRHCVDLFTTAYRSLLPWQGDNDNFSDTESTSSYDESYDDDDDDDDYDE